MGKNTNQIATFNDLQSIGYRIPSAITDLNHCVTYGDFATLDDINNITFNYDSSLTNKLIKWSDIPGTSGQTIGSTYIYTVPIKINAINNTSHSISNNTTFGTVNLGWNSRNTNGWVSGNTLISGTLKFGTTLTLNVPINLIPSVSGQTLWLGIGFTLTLNGYNGNIGNNLTYTLNGNSETLAASQTNIGDYREWTFYQKTNNVLYPEYNSLISQLTQMTISFVN